MFLEEAKRRSVISAAEIAECVDVRSARGIAATVTHLVRSETLADGTALPTIRELASSLEVSPTTVSEAWALLSAGGAIETRGKLGTFVRSAQAGPSARRHFSLPAESNLPRDYSITHPDHSLLPDLGPLFANLNKYAQSTSFNRYRSEPIIPELLHYLRRSWPFPAQNYLACNGGFDGVMLMCETVVKPGTRVVVEHPTAAPFLDMIEYLGGEIVPVPIDNDGMLPDSLRTAIKLNPVVILMQARMASPVGHRLTAQRAAELAEVIKECDVRPLIIEDDPSPHLSSSPAVSLGTHLPDQVVLVRSWTKSHGPDLRLGVIGGAGPFLETAEARRALSGVWISRILQSVFVEVLNSPAAKRQVQRARNVYQRRRRALSSALTARGIATGGVEGLCLWVPVKHERSAVLSLAAQGIGVAAGSNFFLHRGESDYIRVATSQIQDSDTEMVADAIASVSGQGKLSHLM